MDTAEELIKFFQSSISPIILISGVGLILLSLTNRLGRTIDRSRSLVKEFEKGNVKDHEIKKRELQILFRRSKILRNSITSISFSILCSSLIIPVLLIMSLLHVDLHIIGIILFLFSIIGIILSASFLFVDVSLTLKALELSVREYI